METGNPLVGDIASSAGSPHFLRTKRTFSDSLLELFCQIIVNHIHTNFFCAAVQFVEIETETVSRVHSPACCIRLDSVVVELDTLPDPRWIAEVALTYGDQEKC